MRLRRIAQTVLLIVVLFFTWTCGSNFHTSLQRSRQKRTMADLRTAAMKIEQGLPPGNVRDGWGNAVRVRITDSHYSLRAAGADGEFETVDPRGVAREFDADIVLTSQGFLQYPEGL
jgi:hypothetical protein